MIQRFLNKKGMIAVFGYGTTLVRRTISKADGLTVGSIKLTTCPPTPVGEVPDESVDCPKAGNSLILLRFKTTDSLDVVIQKLQELREDMINGSTSVD